MAAVVDQGGLNAGSIPLGGTRPAMVPAIGLPWEAAVPLALAAAEVQMAVTGLKGLAYAVGLMVAIGLPLRVWVSYDWYAIRAVGVWLRTMGPALDVRSWGGATVSPFPLHPKWLKRETRGMWHV